MLGLSSLGLGGSVGSYALARRILPPHVRVHRTPLLPLSLLFAGFGLLSIMLGLLAELLTRTYYEAQDKPTYVVKHMLPHASQEFLDDQKMPRLDLAPEGSEQEKHASVGKN
jgi:hypothetical protein